MLSGLTEQLEGLRNWMQNRDDDFELPKVDLTGTVAIVTGANRGIGKETAKGLAKMGAKVIIACRNVTKAQEAIREIGLSNIRVIKCDLASFASVRQFCKQVDREEKKVDILINNAAAFNTERVLTEDGQEMVFQVNHLSHFLMTNLLMDKLKASRGARIINVSAVGHWYVSLIPFDDLTFTRGFFAVGYVGGMFVYALSKLSNILFTVELAKRLKGTRIQAFSLRTGGVGTDLHDELFGKLGIRRFLLTPEVGARTSLWCATEPALSNPKYSGKYFNNCHEGLTSPYAKNEMYAKKLWDISAKITNI